MLFKVSQYTAKKVHLALCSFINCRTCLTNIDCILVLRSTILRPPSAYVFISDFLFKASGLLFQRNGNSNSPLVWYLVKTPYVPNGAAQHRLHGDTFPLNDNSILLYKFTHFSKLEITFPEILLSASFVPI